MVNLDQFYTKDPVAKYFFNVVSGTLDLNDFDLILEPSAGKGSFFKLFPIDKRIGLDLDPKFDGIIKQDFFQYQFQENKRYLVIGNPPFGKNNTLAVKFFNYAAKFSNAICFIIPRTFKRISIQNQLDLNFHLIYTKDLSVNCCFEPKMAAKCCFQIWVKKNELREIIKYPTTHPDFQFIPFGPKDTNNQPTVPDPNLVDFALKAYGSNCGEITMDIINLRPKSWHFIKSNISKDLLIQRFKALDYSLSKDSCRQDSLGKMELIYLYSATF